MALSFAVIGLSEAAGSGRPILLTTSRPGIAAWQIVRYLDGDDVMRAPLCVSYAVLQRDVSLFGVEGVSGDVFGVVSGRPATAHV
jgi:hypothetical protein